MATVTVISAEALDAILDTLVNNIVIEGDGDLVFYKQDGSSVNLGNIKSHNGLTDLSDDDHPQYALTDGSRGAFATTAQGTKADAARPTLNSSVDLGGDDTDFLGKNTVSDDSTSTSSWIDRMVNFFRPVGAADNMRRMVQWWNEYLELRLAPAKHNTVALRIFVRDSSTVQSTARDATVPLLQMMDDRVNRNPIWGLYPDGTIKVATQEVQTRHVIVLTAAASVPTGTPANTVIVRTA